MTLKACLLALGFVGCILDQDHEAAPIAERRKDQDSVQTDTSRYPDLRPTAPGVKVGLDFAPPPLCGGWGLKGGIFCNPLSIQGLIKVRSFRTLIHSKFRTPCEIGPHEASGETLSFLPLLV